MDVELFQKLVKSMSLSIIQPVKIEFERFGDIPSGESNVQINWKMVYPNESPYKIIDNVLQLDPMFDISLNCIDQVIYSHKSIFAIAFNVVDKKLFDELWNNDELQKYFKEKQIIKTLWPIVRQQVLDGLTRLSLPPVALPWLI